MAEYRASSDLIAEVNDERRPWQKIALLMLISGLVIGVLYAAGYWNTLAKEPRPSPDTVVRVSGELVPGSLPASKESIAGTMNIPVDGPSTDPKSGTEVTDK